MSRTYKDAPWPKGQHHRYFISGKGHAEFTRWCRTQARRMAKRALKKGEEPQPHYPVEREYYD